MSETLYFRPVSTQPYHTIRAATWLVRIGKFSDIIVAYDWLIDLEMQRPNVFRHYMDEYHRLHTFKTGYLVETDDSKAFRSVRGSYGTDSHMYYSRCSH